MSAQLKCAKCLEPIAHEVTDGVLYGRCGCGRKRVPIRRDAENPHAKWAPKTRVRGVCLVCGAKFLTDPRSPAKTCEGACRLKRRNQLHREKHPPKKRGTRQPKRRLRPLVLWRDV